MYSFKKINYCIHKLTNLIIELYKYQAESERKRIIERQQQGIALAKQQDKYHGRKPQYTQDDPRLQHAFKLYQAGMSDVDVARNTGIKRTTFIRYRKKYRIFKNELIFSLII
ncbi:hypothetical protein IMAU30046_00474 [Lactobacillus helveticus]|nr:hypothetical protein [Lactobacillus helveticus]